MSLFFQTLEVEVSLAVGLEVAQIKPPLYLEHKERPDSGGSSQQELDEGPGGVRLAPVLAVHLQVLLQSTERLPGEEVEAGRLGPGLGLRHCRLLQEGGDSAGEISLQYAVLGDVSLGTGGGDYQGGSAALF